MSLGAPARVASASLRLGASIPRTARALPPLRWLGRPLDDALTWSEVDVDGRRANYASGGHGPPVLFLHGWGLGSRSYRGALTRLVRRGCHVYCPALPAFGGTSDLPGEAADLAGYGAWVASFMGAVGLDGATMVIGHSFGGGVAIELAEQHPELVGYLVLLNAVGTSSARSVLHLAAGFARELWPLPEAVEALDAIAPDLIGNVVRNPRGLVRVAGLARRADLRAEAARLTRRGLPVLVITSDNDTVIPQQAFDSLCQAIGSPGVVVSGRHSWLLADPDSFGAALSDLVDGHVDERRRVRATGRAGEVAALLARTAMPKRVARDLVGHAPPLWLMSASAPALASDLVLAHPYPKPGEVRAVSHPIEGLGGARVTVVARDRTGLLADSAAVLAGSGLSIAHASAATWPAADLALHSFVVAGVEGMDARAWDGVGAALSAMAERHLRQGTTAAGPVAARPARVRPTSVTVHGDAGDRLMVTVTAADRAGILAALCASLAGAGIGIESLHARSERGVATDVFILQGAPDTGAVEQILRQA